MTELPKTFDPAEIESRWYARWEGQGLFRPERPDAEPFTIVIPPPNVTGSLHIGHALDNTLQDILIRHARLQGKDSLWVVGMDHAGIATQMVVERNLESQGVKRTDMGREAFIEHVWEWKAQSGGAITRQLRRLGASCDWANERFTMDPGFSAAVLKVFVQLYRDGLLYRDKRLVNWDPKFGTAISDLEVETREVQGQFWHLRYPLEDGSGFIRVATTRPETMLADMAVAVHPDDGRYAELVGKSVRLPITGRLVPIIRDEHADPELGSGAVKITPGHDFNDFEVGKRAGMKPSAMLNMFDGQARVAQCGDIPDELVGLDRFAARKRVVEMLEAEGALEKVEERTIQLPYGDRSGVVIEPWLTDQWYVDAKTLAGPAIEAVRTGDINVVPKTWEKTWFNWLENIQPWCVSRQLWWGHRIPAWYGPATIKQGGGLLQGSYGEGFQEVTAQRVFVAEDEAEASAIALSAYREVFGEAAKGIAFSDDPLPPGFDLQTLESQNGIITLRRDLDVLDTWFSSALWPFATLGWPEQTEELKRHYPNDVLISGFDIIFFWDARMAMQGLHFMGEAPWKTLYLHGLVRDSKGQKMSKSKGNTVDPLGLIDKYGADALRFTLAAMESQGRDIKLDEKRVEGYRNFATKLWNAARFLQMNGVRGSETISAPQAALPVNRWIIGEVVETIKRVDRAFLELRFDDVANVIYHFAWDVFCDNYLEEIKPRLADQSEPETTVVAGWVFDQILVTLHPLMPFITEELWHAMGYRSYPLIVAKWADPQASVDKGAKRQMEQSIAANNAILSARAEVGVPPSAKLEAWAYPETESAEEAIVMQMPSLKRRARIEKLNLPLRYPNQTLEAETGTITVVGGEVTFKIRVGDHVDLDAYRLRLLKNLEAAEKERDSLAGRLANPSFVERAKPEAVEKARADHAEKASDAEKYRAALARLG